MSCWWCQSETQGTFASEVWIQRAGHRDLTKPAVCVFSGLVVCLDCGFTEFRIAEAELGRLAGNVAGAIFGRLYSA
jgi:hypothetical protein